MIIKKYKRIYSQQIFSINEGERMKRLRYLRRVANYSIVFGILSSIGNSAEMIKGDLNFAVIIIPVMMIMAGFLLLSNIKKGNPSNIHSMFLSNIWLTVSFFSFFLIFSNFLIFIILAVFLIYPLYNLYKYYVFPKDLNDWFQYLNQVTKNPAIGWVFIHIIYSWLHQSSHGWNAFQW